MTGEQVVSLILAVAIAAYLVFTLIFPEKL